MALTPTRRDEFDEDTGYERSVLDGLFEAKAQTQSREIEGIYVDLRGTSTVIAETGGASLGGSRRTADVALLRPLAFGAAFKVLDLVVELAHEQVYGPLNRITFNKKMTFVAASGFALPQPFDHDRALAQRAGRLYTALEDGRHSVAHRRLAVGLGGSVIPTDQQGNPCRPITPVEVDALAYLSSGLADAIVAGVMQGEQALNALYWHVDRLGGVHKLPNLGAEEHRPVTRPILANLARQGERLLPDVNRVRAFAESQGEHAQGFAQVCFESADGWSVTTTLRRVPAVCEAFVPDAPPLWVDEVLTPEKRSAPVSSSM